MAPPTFTAGFVDELTELYPDSQVGPGTPESLTVESPRGSFAGAHLLLNGLQEGQTVTFQAPPGLKWYRLIDVPVEVNTGTDGRTERLNNKVNPDVVRRAPFRIYDALQPVEPTFVAESGHAAFRIEWPVSRDAKPETKSFRIDIHAGKESRRLELKVAVSPAAIPSVGRESVGFTNWWSVGNVASYHKVEPWSPGYWAMLGRYADLMARSRQNTILVPWSSFMKREGERFKLDRASLKRFVDLFTSRGIYWLEGGHFAGREGGDWMAKRFVLNLTGTPVNDDKGRAELRTIAIELDDAIRAEGWQKRWLQHLADEPIDVNVQDYAQMAEQVRLLMPMIPIFEATMSQKLVGAVDAWCPQLHEFQAHLDWFTQRQADNDQVWAYTCLTPTGPWLNRLLDMERLRPVYIGWAIAKYNLDGFLHWGFNYWHADPFEVTVVRHSDAPESDAMALPAGDTHVAYPGLEGPLSSTRLEAHRIGMEDAEMLKRLKLTDPAAYSRILGSVFRDAKDYSKSVAEYRRARHQLLEAFAKARGASNKATAE